MSTLLGKKGTRQIDKSESRKESEQQIMNHHLDLLKQISGLNDLYVHKTTDNFGEDHYMLWSNGSIGGEFDSIEVFTQALHAMFNLEAERHRRVGDHHFFKNVSYRKKPYCEICQTEQVEA